jgi:hypothetical protein
MRFRGSAAAGDHRQTRANSLQPLRSKSATLRVTATRSCARAVAAVSSSTTPTEPTQPSVADPEFRPYSRHTAVELEATISKERQPCGAPSGQFGPAMAMIWSRNAPRVFAVGQHGDRQCPGVPLGEPVHASGISAGALRLADGVGAEQGSQSSLSRAGVESRKGPPPSGDGIAGRNALKLPLGGRGSMRSTSAFDSTTAIFRPGVSQSVFLFRFGARRAMQNL